MREPVETYLLRRQPTAARPLLGLTILLVEDSRFASEAVRLMCLRSGARIRRADCLASAHRHLRTYRPSAAIVDLGLPDGHGEDLIRELVGGSQPVQVVLATSGDPDGHDRALAAGAQGFLEKPVRSLGDFQQTILSLLPPENRPLGLRLLPGEDIEPDPIAFRDDIAHMAELLSIPEEAPPADYVAQFMAGLARTAGDDQLGAVAEALGRTPPHGSERPRCITRLRALLAQRLAEQAIL